MLEMIKKNRFFAGVLSGLVFFCFTATDAKAACTINDPSVPPALQTYTLPINRLSPNVYNNNVLLSVKKYFDSAAVRCATSTVYWVYKIESTSGTTGIFVDGSPVYKTNIDGLGVYYTYFNLNGMYISSQNAGVVLIPEINLNLIKLNNSTVSGVLDASTLPVVSFYATESSSGIFNSSAVQITKLALRGSVSYVVPSCSAQDNDIWLGEYSNSDFTGASTTPWVDASIVLTCDAAFLNAYNSVVDNFITGKVTTTTRADNYYSVSLESVNGFIDLSRGIMALDSGGASGLGVQISRTRSEQAWSSLAWTDGNQAGANTIKIPLYARYIQTESNVTAGQAKTKLLYTVQYK
ncbi:fimbrial protein [Klebsiella spallanzanii]|uniref:Fimbrial-type adhesion domain-containing protein n=1 Tax=Klebsiella spallanzanii TaxID=2587528 RepID=A0A564J9H5_9ENTR|nr:fimbrial protein [Klebsiella spallanzanii]VUS53128.1 hypothetical protein SB6408_04470 [Klebsiella spallanzanii]